MESKILKGAKTIGKALTTPNTIENGGGLSSLIVRRKFNPAGAGLIMGGIGAITLGNEGLKGHNKATMGKVRYAGGPARMTQSFTSGAVQAMHKASDGNYAVFNDMAEEVVSGTSLSGTIETYGATPELISALYRMR